MFFWIAVLLMLGFSALILASALRAHSEPHQSDELSTARAFYAQQQAELQTDLDAGKMAIAEFDAAKLELDREFLRQSNSISPRPVGAFASSGFYMASIGLVMVVATVTYLQVGNPGLSNAPLAQRVERGADLNLDDAIQKIEKRLFDVPDDLQGWKVIAPIYMQQQAYDKAMLAFRNIVRLEGRSADSLTNLAEAAMLFQQGDATGEPMKLLNEAAVLDPDHIRSQFYLAGEATRKGDHQTALPLWQKIIASASGNEPWLPTARAGLRVAEEGLGIAPEQAGPNQTGPTEEQVDAAAQMSDKDRREMIDNMVSGLQERLLADGGSSEEWYRLLRARLVQGDVEAAKFALLNARQNLASDQAALAQFENLAKLEIMQIEKEADK